MPIYTFKIDLNETSPLVTRTFKVSSEISMYLMHQIIQEVMGWKNYHLYEFKIDGNKIADTRLLDEELGSITDCKTVMVEDVFTHLGKKCQYEYDFGDGWLHVLELIEISNNPVNVVLPIIVSGENACPPEDCGGVDGYAELKEILKNPKHEEFKSTWIWVGLQFNPFKFNIKATEKSLARLNANIQKYESGFNE